MARFPEQARAGEPLGIHLKPIIDTAVAALRLPFAEYSFANLFLFRDLHDYRFVSGPCPFISGYAYDGQFHGMPLAPTGRSEAAALLDHVDCLYPVTGDMFEMLGPAFAATANRDDSDYLYSAQMLAKLGGRELKTKRQQAAAYRSRFVPSMALDAPDFREPALLLLDRWQADVGKPAEMTDYAQCLEAISLADCLELETALLFGNGEPHGFLIASRLGDGSKAVHFAKARRDIAGSYPILFSSFAQCCGAETLNFEQDMGKAGFRQAKRALGPKSMLTKFRIGRIV